MTTETRGAVLQFEFDRNRIGAFSSTTFKTGTLSDYEVSGTLLVKTIARRCLDDIWQNGGTLVVIASDSTITIVQRPKGSDTLP